VGVVPILSEANHPHQSPAQLMTIYVALIAEHSVIAIHSPVPVQRVTLREPKAGNLFAEEPTRPRREVVINV
jgi:hypothetical protein